MVLIHHLSGLHHLHTQLSISIPHYILLRLVVVATLLVTVILLTTTAYLRDLDDHRYLHMRNVKWQSMHSMVVSTMQGMTTSIVLIAIAHHGARRYLHCPIYASELSSAAAFVASVMAAPLNRTTSTTFDYSWDSEPIFVPPSFHL